MIEIKLFTAKNEYVTTVEVPKEYKQLPNSIMWGERFFFKQEREDAYFEGWMLAGLVSPKSLHVGKPFVKCSVICSAKNIDEASDLLLELLIEELGPKLQGYFDATEAVFTRLYYHGVAVVWWDNRSPEKPPLVRYFNDMGIWHSDDMACLIMKHLYRKRNNIRFILQSEIQGCKNFWKSQGFTDGKPIIH